MRNEMFDAECAYNQSKYSAYIYCISTISNWFRCVVYCIVCKNTHSTNIISIPNSVFISLVMPKIDLSIIWCCRFNSLSFYFTLFIRFFSILWFIRNISIWFHSSNILHFDWFTFRFERNLFVFYFSSNLIHIRYADIVYQVYRVYLYDFR